jgi:hypothetical protein
MGRDPCISTGPIPSPHLNKVFLPTNERREKVRRKQFRESIRLLSGRLANSTEGRGSVVAHICSAFQAFVATRPSPLLGSTRRRMRLLFLVFITQNMTLYCFYRCSIIVFFFVLSSNPTSPLYCPLFGNWSIWAHVSTAAKGLWLVGRPYL